MADDDTPARFPQQQKFDKTYHPDPSLVKQSTEQGMLFPHMKSVVAEENLPDIIESYCVACGENGETRLLLTKIPFFREVIIMSFHCEHCGYASNEVQYGGKLEPQAITLTLKVDKPSNINRQIILSDFAKYSIPELDFEAPQASGHGVFTTVEGLLQKTIDSLEQDQPVRKIMEPVVAEQISKFIERVRLCKDGSTPFTLVIDDISGNSHVDNIYAPSADPDTTVTKYDRTENMDAMLGINTSQQTTQRVVGVDEALVDEAVKQRQDEKDRVALLDDGDEGAVDSHGHLNNDEILTLPSSCANCMMPVDCHIKQVDIPHFKEVIIYAVSCDHCGVKTNEVRSGGATEAQGIRYTLNLNGESEWRSRDVLKSTTCVLHIPELQFESSPSTLGGSFTTVEGLLTQAFDQLADSPFLQGDGSHTSDHNQMVTFLQEFKKVLDGGKNATLIFEDPAGTSYVQNLYAPDPDPDLLVERYDRTEADNEELGLNDMKTENYA